MPALVSDSPTLYKWIRENTDGSRCVVDLGAGFFDKLRYVTPLAHKIGIEVFPSYLSFAPVGVTAMIGDIREWERLIEPKYRDTAMLIDVIEHMSKSDGLLLLRSLKAGFRKVLLMTPDGFVEQNEDVTGYGNEWQVHMTGWTKEELEAEGMVVELKANFHPQIPLGALFAVYERPAHDPS
jgi:hypothetical protein